MTHLRHPAINWHAFVILLMAVARFSAHQERRCHCWELVGLPAHAYLCFECGSLFLNHLPT